MHNQLLIYLLFLTNQLIVIYSFYNSVHTLITQIRKSKCKINAHLNPIADEIIGWNKEFYNTFIQKYHQKQPLLIRNAFPNIQQQLNLNTLDYYELAQDKDVDTRLFRKIRNKTIKDYGPFEIDYLSSLPSNNWSILLQEVDRHIPQVNELWYHGFEFIPCWRRDDIMISYSLPGGGIGGHVDNYDVFLLQGSGVREWSIENRFITESEENAREIPNNPTKLLKDFQPDQLWTMYPGDMISIGFRAPNYKSLITAFWEDICSTKLTNDNSFYKDKKDLIHVPESSGLISIQARTSIASDIINIFQEHIEDNDQKVFNQWLGKYLTMPIRYRLRKPRAFFISNLNEKEDDKLTSHIDINKTNDKTIIQDDVEDDNNQDHMIDDINIDDNDENIDFEGDFDEDFDEDDGLLPYIVRSKHSIASKVMYSDVESVLMDVLNSNVILRRLEGVRFAYIEDVLFIDGESYPIPPISVSSANNNNISLCKSESEVAVILCDYHFINKDLLEKLIGGNRNSAMSIIRSGYYYPV